MSKEVGKENTATTFELFKRLVELAQQGEEVYSSVAFVKSVNKENATVTVEIVGGAVLEDVRLQQVPASGVLLLPKEESLVVISWVNDTTAFVSLTSEITDIAFIGDNFGGLIKIQDLTDKINELVKAFNDHTHTIPKVVTNGSPSTQTAVNVVVPKILTPAKELNRADYENTQIKHGGGEE